MPAQNRITIDRNIKQDTDTKKYYVTFYYGKDDVGNAKRKTKTFESRFEVSYTDTFSYVIGSIGGVENGIAAFSSGWGDGCYPTYFGFDGSGEPCALVTDFLVLD